MIYIVGLGNPEMHYTRHNIGFDILNYLAEGQKWNNKKSYMTCIYNNTDTLIKPMTYMNYSGKAIQNIIPSNSQFIVIHDDLELDFGKIKLTRGMSAKGHNGIKNIYQYFNRDHISRIRIGIGRPKDKSHVEKYVLGKFTQHEIKYIESKLLIEILYLISSASSEISSASSE